MKLLTNITDIDRSDWKSLAEHSSVACIFQTLEMYDFYSVISPGKASVFAVEENNKLKGLVVALLQAECGLKRHFTARAIINGGPLLADDISVEAMQMLLSSCITVLKRQSIYVETRNLNDYSRWRSVFEKCGFGYVPHYNFHIDTTDSVMVDKRMDKSRRRRIRRATENGVTIACENPDIKGFYDILSNLYRTKIHKPLPPLSMFEQLGKMPFAKYFIVKDSHDKTIGGQLILMLDKRVAYAWYCCGLDKEYHDLYPSIMANYAAIRYASDNGFERYDMMGGGSPGEDYGVRDFKAQFGGTLVEHGRFLYLCRPLIYKVGKTAIKLLSK